MQDVKQGLKIVHLMMIAGTMLPLWMRAQESDKMANDTIRLAVADSVLTDNLLKKDSLNLATFNISSFKPNPTKAVIYSAVFPGMGQVYNRKYWKLPLVYGGFMGFIYAVSWNNKNYQDYSNAYFDVVQDDPNDPANWHTSWQNFVPAGMDPATYISDANFHTRLKNGKDFYRRYRDLSIILTVGWYLICMADSYVDAQLFDFDISPDLSLRIDPVISPSMRCNPSMYGLSCCIKF